jgi:hypothetical protein
VIRLAPSNPDEQAVADQPAIAFQFHSWALLSLPVAALVSFFFFLGFFAFSRAALVLAADFRDPPILPISLAVSCLVMVLNVNCNPIQSAWLHAF